MKIFHMLMSSIESHTTARVVAEETPSIEMFGSYHERIACYLPVGGREDRDVDTDFFVGSDSMLQSNSTQEAVESLGCLTTILEYLIATSELDVHDRTYPCVR